MKENFAIFWDIENVTPSSDSMFVNGLIDHVSENGKISIATAFGDWTRRNLSKIAEILADNSFEMIHVPKSKKNSADFTLVTHATEVLFQYPHISRFVLVTGDADFRPLLQSLRKHGKEIEIICDSKSASEDLLILADSYKDYRDLLPDEEVQEDEGVALSREDAIKLLKEAVQLMKKKKKSTTLGAVKVRIKLLNNNFNERDLGFKSWKDFVLWASKQEPKLEIHSGEKDMFLELSSKPGSGDKVKIPEILYKTMQIMATLKSPSEDEWIFYSQIAQELLNQNVNIRSYGYSRIKRLIEAMEKRGLVENKKVRRDYLFKITDEGREYIEKK